MPTSFDPTNPLHVAMKLTELAQLMQSQQQQQTSAIQNLGSAMQGLQVEIRHISDKVGEIEVLGERQVQGTASIARIWSAIEASNTQQKVVEKRLNVYAGVAIGLSVMSGLVAGTFTWFAQGYVEDTRKAAERTEALYLRTDERLDRLEIHGAGDPQRPFQR